MYKKYSFILLIIFTILTLSSCKLDENIEKTNKIDRDDINIIKKVWVQSVDKATKIFIDSISTAS